MENKLVHYKNSSNIDLLRLIEGNITFSVLYRILQNNCTDIFTNNESIIICYSNAPNPIWVWCKDSKNENNINLIAECIKSNYPLEDNFNIIMSHEVLEQLKKKDDYFKNTSLKMELLSYQLDFINNINYTCDGYFELAKIEELDQIAHIFKDMHYEMEGFVFEIAECRQKALLHINQNRLYTWKNKNGEIVAITSKNIVNDKGSINCVYTLPNQRRKGYAINLVHVVSKELLSNNITPILYTNGDYIASNECYKKIGFKQVGRICNIQR